MLTIWTQSSIKFNSVAVRISNERNTDRKNEEEIVSGV